MVDQAVGAHKPGLLVPPERFGLKVMSIGFLIAEDQPVIWRGPMVSKALRELTGKVARGAHPGMERIVERAARLLGQPVGWAIGGFHPIYADSAAIDRTIRALQDLGVTHVVPTHCTGDAAKAAFLRAFGARCLEGGVGREIQLVGRGRLDLEPLPEA